jgi:hypothetical protein
MRCGRGGATLPQIKSGIPTSRDHLCLLPEKQEKINIAEKRGCGRKEPCQPPP